MINFDSKVLQGRAQGCTNLRTSADLSTKASVYLENTFSVNSANVEDGTQQPVALFDFVLCIASGWLLACPSSSLPAFTMLLRLMEKDFSAQMEFFIHCHRLWEITFYYSRQMFSETRRNYMKMEAFCGVRAFARETASYRSNWNHILTSRIKTCEVIPTNSLL